MFWQSTVTTIATIVTAILDFLLFNVYTLIDMNADALMWAIRSACDVYRTNPNMWRAMQTQAMTQDLSWDNAAKKWEKVFEWSKIDPPHAN